MWSICPPHFLSSPNSPTSLLGLRLWGTISYITWVPVLFHGRTSLSLPSLELMCFLPSLPPFLPLPFLTVPHCSSAFCCCCCVPHSKKKKRKKEEKCLWESLSHAERGPVCGAGVGEPSSACVSHSNWPCSNLLNMKDQSNRRKAIHPPSAHQQVQESYWAPFPVDNPQPLPRQQSQRATGAPVVRERDRKRERGRVPSQKFRPPRSSSSFASPILGLLIASHKPMSCSGLPAQHPSSWSPAHRGG